MSRMSEREKALQFALELELKMAKERFDGLNKQFIDMDSKQFSLIDAMNYGQMNELKTWIDKLERWTK